MAPCLRSLAAGGFLLAASACSLTTAFDGLSGGSGISSDPQSSRDAGGRDAQGTSLDDSGAPIGNDDAGIGVVDSGGGGDDGGSLPPDDSSVPADAADSSPNPGDTSAPPTGYCAGLNPKPLFCADYDEGNVAAGWDQTTSQKGTVALSTTTSTSSPASMKVDTISFTSGLVDAAQYKQFTQLQNKSLTMTLALDVRFETVDTKADVVAASIQLNASNGATYELQIDMWQSTSGDMIVDCPELTTASGGQETYVDHQLTKRVSIGAWHHLELTATAPASAGAGTMNVSIDGASAFSSSINVLVSNWVPEAIVGMSYVAAPSSAWSVRYDNVTFDAK